MYMYDGIAWYCLDGSHLKIDRSFGNADTPGWGRTHISLWNESLSFILGRWRIFLFTNEWTSLGTIIRIEIMLSHRGCSCPTFRSQYFPCWNLQRPTFCVSAPRQRELFWALSRPLQVRKLHVLRKFSLPWELSCTFPATPWQAQLAFDQTFLWQPRLR